MFYNGINLTQIIQDATTFKRWSMSDRAYELFGKTLEDNQEIIELTDPEDTFGWLELVYHRNYPAEIFLVINVGWTEADWVAVTNLANRYETIENQNNIKSKFVESGLTTADDETQRLADQQRFLNALRTNNGLLSKASQASGVSMKTYRQWISNDFTFQEIVSDVAEAVKDDLEHSLMKEAKYGDVQALKLVLGAKAKERGYGKDVVVKEEPKQEVDLSLLSLQEQQQLSRLLKKAQPKQIEAQ